MAEVDEAVEVLESGYAEAEEIVNNPDDLKRFLQQLEEKLKIVPLVGDQLSNIPVFVSMVRSYANGEYSNIPMGTLIAIVSTLLYFLSPFDLIPDAIPAAGYIDDAIIAGACMNLVQSDVNDYKAWRDSRS